MANKKSVGPAGPGEVKAAWFMPEQMVRVPIGELVPYARNARTHSESQIAQIRASLREFGFVNPVIIDSDRNIIAGHGRVLAAKAEGMTEVPCVLVEHLTHSAARIFWRTTGLRSSPAGTPRCWRWSWARFRPRAWT